MTQVFTDEEIRDTVAVDSSIAKIGGYRNLTVSYKNTHNQIITINVIGSTDRDFTNPVPLGDFTAAASMTAWTYEWLRVFKPYLKLQAQAAVSPASGNLNAELDRSN